LAFAVEHKHSSILSKQGTTIPACPVVANQASTIISTITSTVLLLLHVCHCRSLAPFCAAPPVVWYKKTKKQKKKSKSESNESKKARTHDPDFVGFD
jgi:hypothetical protein